MAQVIPTIDKVKAEAMEIFHKEFGNDPDICVFAPGRVNLIGEHTDYNEGFVLPMVIYIFFTWTLIDYFMLIFK